MSERNAYLAHALRQQHDAYLARVMRLIAAYPPRSDVASRKQVVPCWCGEPIYCPQDAPGTSWHANHVEHSDRPMYLWTTHHAIARPHLGWRDGEEPIVVWLPDKETPNG